MRLSKAHTAVFAMGIALASVGLVGCSSSSPTTSAPTATAAPATEAPATDAPAEGATSYCDPLVAAYAIKPASGEPASDADLEAFGKAMLPVAAAAEADGNQKLAAMFTLIAKVNSDPNGTTDAQTSEALNEVMATADEVNAACGVDLLQ